MDGTERFLKQWKVPKQLARELYAEKRKVEEKHLKDFEEEAALVFNLFEGLTRKKVNRPSMVAHIAHYLDEGFKIEEMTLYVRDQVKELFYIQNPEKLTIMNLFPIDDPKREAMTWDRLSYYQSVSLLPVEERKAGDLLLRMPCGEKVLRSFYDEHLKVCLKAEGKCFLF